MNLNVKNLMFKKMHNFMNACYLAYFSNTHFFWNYESKVTLVLFLSFS